MKANNVTFVCANCGSNNININESNNQEFAPRTVIQYNGVPTANGIPAGVIEVLRKYLGSVPAEMVTELAALPGGTCLAEVVQEIQDGGHISSPVIVRRWVNAQMMRLLAKDLEDRGALHREIKKRGWDYAWDVVFNEWKVFLRMFREIEALHNKPNKTERDKEDLSKAKDELAKRMAFYSPSVVSQMMTDYVRTLMKHLEALKKGKVRKCEGERYVLFHCTRNNYKGLFVREFNNYIAEFNAVADAFNRAFTLKEEFKELEKFRQLVRGNRWNPNCGSNAFTNAFRAVGGYFTLKDLILFENVRICDGSVEENVRKLDEKMLDILGADGEYTQYDGYRLLGILRDALGHTDDQKRLFVHEKRTQWHEAYKARRAARRNSGC